MGSRVIDGLLNCLNDAADLLLVGVEISNLVRIVGGVFREERLQVLDQFFQSGLARLERLQLLVEPAEFIVDSLVISILERFHDTLLSRQLLLAIAQLHRKFVVTLEPLDLFLVCGNLYIDSGFLFLQDILGIQLSQPGENGGREPLMIRSKLLNLILLQKLHHTLFRDTVDTDAASYRRSRGR